MRKLPEKKSSGSFILFIKMKLDIIIPCYNAVETLERAVKSCLNQTNVHAIYLIDDASTDNTWYLKQWSCYGA